MIELLVIALVIAVVVGLVLSALVGPVLSGTGVPILATIGAFFTRYGWVIGVLAGVVYFFTNGGFGKL